VKGIYAQSENILSRLVTRLSTPFEAHQFPQAARFGVGKQRISLSAIVFVERLVINNSIWLLRLVFPILGNIFKVLDSAVLRFVEESRQARSRAEQLLGER
jgi:hypothetical protein